MLRIALRYGLWMGLGFIGFFLIMHVLGLSQYYYLRVFNGVIHTTFMWFALRAWYREHPDRIENYASGVAVGMSVSIVGIIPFMVFLAIFLGLNPGFLMEIQSQTRLGHYLTPVTASASVLMEGVCISLILSYILVRVIEMLHERREGNQGN